MIMTVCVVQAYVYLTTESLSHALTTTEIILDFQPTAYTVQEGDGAVTNVINIAKVGNPPPSEVDIPLRVLILSGSAEVGTGKGHRESRIFCV